MAVKLWSLILIASILAISPLTAQSEVKPLRVWADGASYMYFEDRTKSYVEIYCAIQRADFQFEEKDGAFKGYAILFAEALDRDGLVVDSTALYLPMQVAFSEDAYKDDIRIFEILPMLLPAGHYKMRVTAMDGITNRKGIATFELVVKDFSGPKLIISDLELAYSVEPADTSKGKSSLFKGDKRVFPNPNRYFSNDDSLLYFYSEIYNFAPPPGEFEITIKLSDTYGYPLRELPPKRIKKPGTTAVYIDQLSISGLPGGSFDLNIQVEDLANNQKSSTSKRFMIIFNFDQLAPTMVDAEVFTEKDAAMMEDVIKYITTREEKETYRAQDIQGKKRFLSQFWERKNPEPGSKINVYKNEIFRRFAYANQFFSTTLLSRTDGWKTDRGRIYITYGQPDNIERFPSSMGQKPYEKWYYDRLPDQSGGNICLFVDLDGYGNYRLVHSTIKGEVENPDWEQQIEDETLR